MVNYLLEIGTEELPAGQIPEAESQLTELVADALKEHSLNCGGIASMSTPRRLALLISDLKERQETVTRKVKGPPVKASYNASGNPTQAAKGFADKQGIKVDQLEREEIGGIEYIIANVTIEGKPAGEVLSDIMPRVISQLSFERPMRWGSSDTKFSRPIRWLVSLLGDKVVEFSLGPTKAGRKTQGHRILSGGEIELKNADDYVPALKQARVLVDPEERRRVIKESVSQAAEKLKGRARQLSSPLLDEVVNLTEWPCAVVGEFGREYLELPDTLIETIMVHHQRYFPVEKLEKESNGDGIKNDLLPFFITVSNNDRQDALQVIKQGNERVIRARLADGRFFYFDDQKTPLTERKASLAQLTFDKDLGSYSEKVERLVKLCRTLTDTVLVDARIAVCLERTAELCKLDLVTNLVRELPELQGYVGSWYATHEGEPPDVVKAIASHYAPRHTDDAIPADRVGQLMSVVDKLDTITGMFALGKKPSGSSDPFALRRQAQGLIDILIEGLTDCPINISALIHQLTREFEPKLKGTKKGFNADSIKAEVADFLIQRLKGRLMERVERDAENAQLKQLEFLNAGFKRSAVVDAVLNAKDPLANVPDVLVRLNCLQSLISAPGGIDVVRVGVRIGKILEARGAATPATDDVDDKLFDIDAEKDLWNAFQKNVHTKWQTARGASAAEPFRAPINREQYDEILNLLRPLVPAIDKFFDDVMVNVEEQKKRANRHALLMNIDRYFTAVADFPKLQPLLP
ncbi:MAG TPA: glycine--tRNA ligase subunit beta [Candidatus Obscuribacterales bacterium]